MWTIDPAQRIDLPLDPSPDPCFCYWNLSTGTTTTTAVAPGQYLVAGLSEEVDDHITVPGPSVGPPTPYQYPVGCQIAVTLAPGTIVTINVTFGGKALCTIRTTAGPRTP